MSLTATENLSAEQRFRQAFDRLKSGKPEILEDNAQVSQNNVAKEAGCDPSALRKSRFPALIREIQAYVELQKNDNISTRQTTLKQRKARRTLEDRLADAIKQRDTAQSLVASANRRIIELSEQVESLEQMLDDVRSRPSPIGKR